jgi:hypothetical protein
MIFWRRRVKMLKDKSKNKVILKRDMKIMLKECSEMLIFFMTTIHRAFLANTKILCSLKQVKVEKLEVSCQNQEVISDKLLKGELCM